MKYQPPDSELMKHLTPEMRTTLTKIWLKEKKASHITYLEASIARQQQLLNDLKNTVAPKE